MTLSATATNYQFGDTVSNASATDNMGSTAAWTPSVYLTSGSLDFTSRLKCEGATLAFADSVELVRDPGATSTQTVAEIVRTGGNPSVVKLGLRLRFDASYDATFTSDTAYKFVLIQKIGSGLTASFWLFEVPVARLATQPKRVLVGSRLHLELALEGYQDSSVTTAAESGEELDFIKSPLRICFG
jgi:hypothetical protein